MKPLFVWFIAVITFGSQAVFAQGSLEPSGPPGPTMKTLDQVEPRSPVPDNLNINTPGSYYLTESINDSIFITADDVTLDLNGFTVSRDISTAVINLDNRSNVRIKNGMITGGARGISANGVDDVFIEDLVITDSFIQGIASFDPIGFLSIENVQIHNVEQAGIRIIIDDDQDVRLRIVNTTVTNSNLSTGNTRAAISVAHIGTGDLTVAVLNNQSLDNRTLGIVISQEGTGAGRGVIANNRVSGNGTTGLFVIGDFTVTKNVAHANTINYNLGSAPNAAPISDLASSPGAWDNISE